MTATEKNRRSARIAAKHNLMLMLEAEEGKRPSKEVVTTLHISKHGAHLLGRKPLLQNVKGRLAHLSTCKQAPFRIAWQSPSRTQPGYHEMGIEFEEPLDFWGTTFEPVAVAALPEIKPAELSGLEIPSEPQSRRSATSAEVDSCGRMLELLRNIPSSADGRETTDAMWCGLVEQLEERRVITRSELIASLRKVGLQL
jgi:hypothetical protein